MQIFLIVFILFIMPVASFAQPSEMLLDAPPLVVNQEEAQSSTAPIFKVEPSAPPQSVDLTAHPIDTEERYVLPGHDSDIQIDEMNIKPDLTDFCAAVHNARMRQADKTKAASVSADYIPEIDVNGRRVVGANLNGQAAFRAFDAPIQIPIELDVAEYMGLTLSPHVQDAATLQPTLSFVSVHDDGRVTFNNQEITPACYY